MSRPFEISVVLHSGYRVTFTEVAASADRALEQFKAQSRWDSYRKRGHQIVAVFPTSCKALVAGLDFRFASR